MKVIKFPGNIMNSSKKIEFVLKICKSVSISNSWDLAFVRHLFELEVREIKGPKIIESFIFTFSPKNIDQVVA